jgi:hypothetical protein
LPKEEDGSASFRRHEEEVAATIAELRRTEAAIER